MVRISLVVPKKGEDIDELRKFMQQDEADIYIFPEGFLATEHLEEALEIVKELDKFIITGLKDERTELSYQTALFIDKGKIVGEYKKNILTESEREKGRVSGDSIYCIDTKYGKIGTPICYEIHFPEVSRIMSLESPVLLINLIGTGMYHELQYDQWTTLAKARAIENEVYVIGCSHFIDKIPLSFVFSPKGEIMMQRKSEYGSIVFDIDLNESKRKVYKYCFDRLPKHFKKLCEEE